MSSTGICPAQFGTDYWVLVRVVSGSACPRLCFAASIQLPRFHHCFTVYCKIVRQQFHFEPDWYPIVNPV